MSDLVSDMEQTETTTKTKPAQDAGKKAIVLPLYLNDRGLDYLVDLVKQIRPSRPHRVAEAEQRFRALLDRLQQDPGAMISLRTALRSVFHKTEVLPALVESGLISSRGFVQELGAKLKHKVLPEIQEPSDFLYVISHVFYKKTDYQWISSIDPELWKRFFRLLRVYINMNDAALISQLHQALRILSFRVTTLGLEKEVVQRFGTNKDALAPFVEQNRLVNLYFDKNAFGTPDGQLILYNVQEQLYNCRQSVIWLRDQKLYHGTSLAQTFVTTRMLQMIERMLLITDVLDRDNKLDEDRFISYFFTVVTNENKRNSVREFMSDNLGLLAYQIAEHKSKKGEKFITTNRDEYRQMFRSAVGGGVIISVVAVIKILLGKLLLPPFWQGIAYSVNYSAGFIAMDRTNTTLATKQPAYTASAVALSLDSKKNAGKTDLRQFSIAIANIVRSQTASFAGNLLVVFPLTYGIVWLMDYTMGYRIVDQQQAFKLLENQHPWHSFALLYASFTGVFLFLSGIIAGYVENHIVFGRLTDRLRQHPVLSHSMSPKRLNGLVDFVNRYAAAFTGSLALGFFLGMSAVVGKIFGIPFDIRHITISAGSTAIGFFGMEGQVDWLYMLVVVLGVLAIGFVNFFVSFSLAFFVAVRSRGIQLHEYPELISRIWQYIRKYPMDLLFPPKKPRRVEDI